MVGISNLYIKTTLDELPLKYWTGVFSMDQLTLPIPDYDFAVIVNFSNLNEKGTHFVALVQIKQHLVLFDSLATPYEFLPERLQNIMTQYNGQYLLPYPIQDETSEFCGFYAMYFILYLSLPRSVRNQFNPNQFSSTNLLRNDVKCIQLITCLLYTSPSPRDS